MEISIVPKFIIRSLSGDSDRQMHWNVLISSVFILLLAGLIKMSFIDAIPHVCLIDKFTGLPCPGCGITRSVLSLYDFKLMDSLRYNPNGLFLITSLVLQIPMRIVALSNLGCNALVNKLTFYKGRFLLAMLLIYWILQIIHLKY